MRDESKWLGGRRLEGPVSMAENSPIGAPSSPYFPKSRGSDSDSDTTRRQEPGAACSKETPVAVDPAQASAPCSSMMAWPARACKCAGGKPLRLQGYTRPLIVKLKSILKPKASKIGARNNSQTWQRIREQQIWGTQFVNATRREKKGSTSAMDQNEKP